MSANRFIFHIRSKTVLKKKNLQCPLHEFAGTCISKVYFTSGFDFSEDESEEKKDKKGDFSKGYRAEASIEKAGDRVAKMAGETTHSVKQTTDEKENRNGDSTEEKTATETPHDVAGMAKDTADWIKDRLVGKNAGEQR